MRSTQSILVTGGAGFIGSALVRHLLDIPSLQRLVVLDKLTYAGDPGNLIGPDHDERFHFVQGDICDAGLLARLLTENDITGVFHLAAESHVTRAIENAHDCIATNIYGTSRLIDACRAAGVPLLHCSTDEVYGSIDAPGKATELSALNPSSAYAASKASADHLCLAAHKSHGLDVVVTRSTNNYGPRQHTDNFIPTLTARARRDEPMPVYGDGMQIRDWIHVDDHCRGMIAAYLRGPAGHVFNFGGRCERTNLGIARSVLSILGKSDKLITSVEDRPGHDRRHAVDCSKAMNYFSWTPQCAFKTHFPSVIRELTANDTPPAIPPGESRWAPKPTSP